MISIKHIWDLDPVADARAYMSEALRAEPGESAILDLPGGATVLRQTPVNPRAIVALAATVRESIDALGNWGVDLAGGKDWLSEIDGPSGLIEVKLNLLVNTTNVLEFAL